MTKLTVLILSFIAFGCSQSNNPIEFYVDVTGNDSNQGTLEAPFKTIEQAKNAIRALSEQQRQKNINVYLIHLIGQKFYVYQMFHVVCNIINQSIFHFTFFPGSSNLDHLNYIISIKPVFLNTCRV